MQTIRHLDHRELLAGLSVTALALPICLASGVLAYGPLGASYAGYGAAAAVLCGAIGGMVAALARSSSFILTTPSTPSALILAGGVAGVMSAAGNAPEIGIVALPLIVLCSGLFQIVFAALGLGRLVKFAPSPVVSGFVSGIATLIILGQLPLAFGFKGMAQMLTEVTRLGSGNWPLAAFSAGLFALLWAMARVAPKLPSALVAIVVGMGLYHLAQHVAPALPLGPRLGTVSLGFGTLTGWLDPGKLKALVSNAEALQAILVCAATLALIGTLETVMGIRAAQSLDDIPADPVRDPGGVGLGNVASAFSGGIAVTTSVALLTAMHQSGGRTRVATIATSVALLLLILLLPQIIAQIPLAIFPPLLLFLAIRLFDRSTLAQVRAATSGVSSPERSRARRNLLVQLAVLAPTAISQPAVGVLAGVAISCLIFIVEMSRPVIARAATAATVSSKRARSRADAAFLREKGEAIRTFDLQGPMFFGNAEDLGARIREVGTGAQAIVLDFRRVTDIDASGASVLAQIAKRCKGGGTRVLVSGLPDHLEGIVGGVFESKACFETSDGALEAAENALLATRTSEIAQGAALELEALDVMDGIGPDQRAVFERYLRKQAYPAGAVLCREGDPGDRIWFLRRGSVSIVIGEQGKERRVGSLGAGTTIGEMGVLEGKPRSAAVVADEAVELYELSSANYHRLLAEAPDVGHAVLTSFIRDISDRLRARTTELAVALQ